MRANKPGVLGAILICGSAGFVWLSQPPDARASALCPAAVTQPVVTPGTCTVSTPDTCVDKMCKNSPGVACEFPVDCPAVITHPTCTLKGVCTSGPGGTVTAGCTANTTTFKTATGFKLQNGVCTNSGSGGIDPGAFSGATLASQALSDLSQTTSQETTRNTTTKITDRREAEQQRCAEGFTRVDGECQPIKRPEREAKPAVEEKKAAEAKPAGEETRKLKKAKKAKVVAAKPEEEEVPAAKPLRRKKPQPKPAQAAVEMAPPPMVCKDGPCAPIPVEPPIRFGTWTQVIGDYEHRDASSPAFVTADTGALAPLNISVQSKTGTVGFQAGGDLTARGVLFPDDGIIVGAMAGFVSSKLTLNTSSQSGNFALVNNGSGEMNAHIYGPVAGLYASYFDGGFSTDLLLKVDAFDLNQTFNDNLAFTSGGVLADGTFLPAFNFLASGSGSVTLLAATVFADLNYRFVINPHFWVEPTVGAQYTNTSYGGGAAELGLEDGNLVMVQGGARLGTDFYLGDGTHTIVTLTGLAYDDVLVSGGFIPGAGFLGNNILARSDQGQVRGRGQLSFNFEFGQGLSGFILGDVRGGQGLFGAGGKAGIRYQW